MVIKKNWYGIYTYANTEKKLYDNISNRHLEAFLPLTTELRQWSDRKKKITLPIFKSYLFAYVDIEGMHIIKTLAGFSHYIRFGGYPTIISQYDIDLIKKIMEHYQYINTAVSNLVVGDKVVIYRGILAGYQGILIKDQKSKKVALSVARLNQSLLVDVSEDNIIKI